MDAELRILTDKFLRELHTKSREIAREELEKELSHLLDDANGLTAAALAHNILSAHHTDTLSTDTPTNLDVLQWITTASQWQARPMQYEHIQSSPNDTWVIVHNLGYRPNVTVFDTIPREVEGDIVHDSANQVTLTFSAAFGGKAYLS